MKRCEMFLLVMAFALLCGCETGESATGKVSDVLTEIKTRISIRQSSNEDFAESLKRGKGFSGEYVALRKGCCGKVFYAFVPNLNCCQDVGAIARSSLHFDSVADLELFERIYIQSGIQCWRTNARALNPDPLGEYFCVDEREFEGRL